MREKRVEEIAAIMWAWCHHQMTWRQAMEKVNGSDREERSLARCIDRTMSMESIRACVRNFVVKEDAK